MQQVTDPYRALGVARDATEAEIKAAHRQLVKRFHPDTGEKTDPTRFLRVQEAYRVLSDPLLRREWDARHTASPVRADRPTTSTGTQRPTRARGAAASAPPGAGRQAEAEPAESPPPPHERETDARARPRSARAYTWSASEVPWWEDTGTKSENRTGTRRRNRPAAATPRDSETAGSATRSAPPTPPPPTPNEPPINAQQDFEVYNRSSGAAWSMAARAYFRRGDADLPRRGSFHHEGSQPLTAGRARTAAEAEAKRRAAAASFAGTGPTAGSGPGASAARATASGPGPTAGFGPGPAGPAAATTAAPASARAATSAGAQPTPDAADWPSRGTTRIVRRSLVVAWPNLTQRFGLALIAWLPPAALIALAGAHSVDQLVPFALIAAILAMLLVIPRIAYIGAVATVLVLLVGGLFVIGILLSGTLPSVERLSLFVGGLLAVGYLATAAVIAIGPSSLRPWSAR
jgi:curved DNA-binding protein CbpA